MIKYLEWDSDFFKKNIGLIETDRLSYEQLKKYIKDKNDNNFDIVYLFTKEIDEKASSFLTSLNIPLVDQKVIYSTNNISLKEPAPNNIEAYKGSLNETLIELAVLSGHESRFNKDPRLRPMFRKLYTKWIGKSLTGEMADVVLIAKENHKIQGFVSIKKENENSGKIGLIAVIPKLHGKGIGSQLIGATHQWYLQNKISKASVVTQLNNKGACKLYEKMGYKIETTTFVYHL